jgi:hypothetical protein
MQSIYQQALGADFQRLHPQIQRRFGFSSHDGMASIGTGVMEVIWRGAFYTVPVLQIGARRNIMFPEDGRRIPFTIENYAFTDALGRETMSFIRTFSVCPTRRFDAYMIYSARRGRIVDYLGNHQHLAVDLELSVNERGGLCIHSGAQRLYEGWLGFPFPMFFSGIADVCEWYDDTLQKFCIEVRVHNRTWGALFGYRGMFEVEWRPVQPCEIPAHAQPMRFEARE